MTLDDYFKESRRTANTKDQKELLINAGLGLGGEVGECQDLIKKWISQGHKLDIEKLALELGDVLWYICQAADGIGLTLEDIAIRNINKLRERYPDGFSTERSIHRKD